MITIYSQTMQTSQLGMKETCAT